MGYSIGLIHAAKRVTDSKMAYNSSTPVVSRGERSPDSMRLRFASLRMLEGHGTLGREAIIDTRADKY